MHLTSKIRTRMATMEAPRILYSSLDKSVNWISKYGKGNVETRFVRKRDDYFIAYVSSHSGCNQGCKFCHLTQQSQTTFDHVGVDAYLEQFTRVVDYYDEQVNLGEPRAERVNINFMARGEPLANKYLINYYPGLFSYLKYRADCSDLNLKVNISTIMPYVMRHRKLTDVFKGFPAHVYYSMYTVDEKFRKEWIPNAIPVGEALDKLKEYEESTSISYPVTFHWALINGKNDSVEGAKETAKVLRDYKFKSKFNLVRYNPHENSNSEESQRIEEIFNIINSAFDSSRSYIVPRVGPDVKASCGMFIPDEE